AHKISETITIKSFAGHDNDEREPRNFPYRNRRTAQQSATPLPGRTLGRSAYLTANRFHPSGNRKSYKLEVSKQKSGNKEPKVGKVVLISDPVLSRNSWKIARITDLKPAIGVV
ncbi:unnamed protein product, partial [Heligmosomoides polygyrus]|uniref:DUF5641 domain-containing protein n=1 Tax=Heligmosomoides polygyrus TaxID=6339 RepID=A0A183G5I7_HELPZ